MLHTLLKLKKKITALRKRKPTRVTRVVRKRAVIRIKAKRPIKVMQNKIVLNGQDVTYTLRLNPRSKSIRLAINSDGEFIVTTPPRVSILMIERIIEQKKEWVMEKIEHFKNIQNPLEPRKTKAEKNADSKASYARVKKDALRIATEKVNQWNAHYKFKFDKISIKNQKTRWGSCSRNGNLNFNYKIALLPEKLADYLVVHEICHLGQFNHSEKFWKLVEETIPDYLEVRKELKGVK